MANLVGKVPPIDASGGELAKLHPVATDVWGSWSVQWPDDMTNKPELEQGRAFGYLSTLGRGAPRFARRAVRRDVQIDARENLGWSNAERQLDSAAEELSGDVVFQRTLRQEDLSGLLPDVDFKQGDLLPLVVWGAALEQPCMMIRRRVEDGQPQVEVRFGGSMIVDRAGLAQANAELERQLASDTASLRKAIKDGVSSARSYADSAVAVERAERRDDVAQVREVLGGAQASEESLVSQLAAVQAQITGMVGDGETPPPAGLLNSYLWMNTKLWEAQQDINRLNEQFQAEVRARQRDQAVLDARQDAQAEETSIFTWLSNFRRPRVKSVWRYEDTFVNANTGEFEHLLYWDNGTLMATLTMTRRAEGGTMLQFAKEGAWAGSVELTLLANRSDFGSSLHDLDFDARGIQARQSSAFVWDRIFIKVFPAWPDRGTMDRVLSLSARYRPLM